MRIFNGIDELRAATGTHLGYSSWHQVTQGQVDEFASSTGDHQWIHVDVERAASGPFGGTIAHGYLTLALVPTLSFEVYRVEGIAMGVNYGADRLRFPSPVLVGAKVRAGVELISVEPGAGGVIAKARVTIEIESSDRPGCVVDTLGLFIPA